MNKLKKFFKNWIQFFKRHLGHFAEYETIKTAEDCAKKKKWVSRTLLLYGILFAVGFIGTLLLYSTMEGLKLLDLIFYGSLFGVVVALYSPILSNFRTFIKSVNNAAKVGYRIGSEFKTENINIRHEYGNTYSATSYTTDKGCLGYIVMFCVWFIVLLYLYCYVGNFLIIKKLIKSIKEIKVYDLMPNVEKTEEINE